MRGKGVESFEEVVLCSVEHAEVVEGAAAAEMLRGEGDAEAGGSEDLVGSAHGGGVKVVVEGVGPEKYFGGGAGECGAAVAAAASIAGEAAVRGEGFGEAREGSLWVDVEDFFDESAGDRSVVYGVDEVGREGCETSEDVDAAEGVVREWAGFAFEVVGKEFGFVGGHVDGDGALALAGFAGEAEIEGLFGLFVLPLVGENFALHEFP